MPPFASALREERRDYTMAAVNRALVSKLTLNGLIWGRMTFGVAAWLAPRPVGNAVGLDNEWESTGCLSGSDPGCA